MTGLRVAAAICNFNRRELLLASVRALKDSGLPNLTVHVYDNASTDGSPKAVREAFGDGVDLTVGGDNTGSSGGFNGAAERALRTEAEIICLIDSDAIVRPGCLETLCRFLGENPEAGIAGAKIYNANLPGTIQETGAQLDFEMGVFRKNLAGVKDAEKPVLANTEVDYVPACCLAARREVFGKAGLFNPGFFIYFDDIDWCTRARALGFGIYAVGGASAVHFSGGANKGSLLPTYYYWRNRLHFFLGRVPNNLRQTLIRNLATSAASAVTCSNLVGKSRTAAIIDRAVRDAFAGRFGKTLLAKEELQLDPALPVPPDNAKILRIPHALADITREAAADGGWVWDSYGLALPAGEALRLKTGYESGLTALTEDYLKGLSAMSSALLT